jgi:tetratricopeptide (TPR) repeat protein
MISNRAVQGIAECERALAIDRNLAAAHASIVRISPRDTYAGLWTAIVGYAKSYAGRDEEAVAWLNRAIELYPNSPAPHLWLAAVLARLGRIEDAREAARAGLELNPSFTIARFRSMVFSDNPAYLAGRERAYEGMRMAGVPEG